MPAPADMEMPGVFSEHTGHFHQQPGGSVSPGPHRGGQATLLVYSRSRVSLLTNSAISVSTDIAAR